MSGANQEAQEEELLALSSIYSEDEFRRADYAPGGEIKVCLELPPNFIISVKSDAATNSILESFEDTVSFLPPIVLNFELTPGYPSTTCPIFTLSCKWLSPAQLTQLCRCLDDLWEENRGSVVLFAWMQFLKEETLESLNIRSPYEIQLHNNGTHSLMQTDEEESHISATASATPEEGAVDGRAIQDVQSVSALIRHILDFNESQQKKHFDSQPFLCNICFCEKLGHECTHFKDCGHVYCNGCLGDYFQVQIMEGKVRALNCPEPKCTSVATPAQVKVLVGEELFSRYDRLLLQSTLDLMTDVVYCPRPYCETPVMQEPEGTMGICSNCQYAFCTLCMMTYHGLSPCKGMEVEPTESTEPMEDTEAELDQPPDPGLENPTQLEEEKNLWMVPRRKGAQERDSKKWVKENTKACPNCKAKIQKWDGCNKMTCSRCGQYFCWICVKKLPLEDPYVHYKDPSSKCFGKNL